MLRHNRQLYELWAIDNTATILKQTNIALSCWTTCQVTQIFINSDIDWLISVWWHVNTRSIFAHGEGEKLAQAAKDGQWDTMHNTSRYKLTMKHSSQWNTPVIQTQQSAIWSYDLLAY